MGLPPPPPGHINVCLFGKRHAIESDTVKYLAEIRFVTTIFINIYGLEEQLKHGGGFLLQQVSIGKLLPLFPLELDTSVAPRLGRSISCRDRRSKCLKESRHRRDKSIEVYSCCDLTYSVRLFVQVHVLARSLLVLERDFIMHRNICI